MNLESIIFSIILPFILMILLSFTLIHFVVFAIRKFESKLKHNDDLKFRRDIKLALSVIGLDLKFILTQLSNAIFEEIVYDYWNFLTLGLILQAWLVTFFALDFLIFFDISY